MVFFLPFWILIICSFMLALIAMIIRKPNFIDILIIIMVIAVSMSLDMLFCKQFELYYYVDINNRGWYSFWANFVMTPAFAIAFIKFIPIGKRRIAIYIIMFSVACTLIEMFIIMPAGIVIYNEWKPFPHSTIGYIIVLTWEVIYYKILKNKIKTAI